MKRLILFLLLLKFSFQSNGQNNLNGNSCSNINGFLSSEIPQKLSDIAVHVDINSGMVMVNPNAWLEKVSINEFWMILNLSSDYSFELKKENTIRGKIYRQYQEYYKGVRVENGGFTVASLSSKGGGRDCFEAYLMSLGVVTGLGSTSTKPLIEESNIKSIIESHPVSQTSHPLVEPVSDLSVNGEINTELIITIDENCDSHLAWRIEYNQEGAKIAWIDAETGIVLKILNNFTRLNAPIVTQAYANPDISDPANNLFQVVLDDSTIDGVTSLISADGRVQTYDFGNVRPSEGTYDVYTSDLIPKTSNSTWTNEAASHVYQTHFAATKVLPAFDEIGINFGKINIAATTVFNALSFGTSTTDAAFIFIGMVGGTTAIYDVVGHELGHAHLEDFFSYTTLGRGTLHEAIADMIGTYVESEIQGEVDWLMGDDEPDVTSKLIEADPSRDLSAVPETCFDNINSEPDQYKRGGPLRHLFYIISEGQGGGNVIPHLGVKRALEIILDGVYMLGSGTIDYQLLQTATLMQAEINYGECSNEYIALDRGWAEICVPQATPSPCFLITPNKTVCEENNFLEICIDGGIPPYDNYNWYFPLEWAVLGNPSGNQVNGRCLTVTDFPDYNYYPQSFIVYVRHQNVGGFQRVRVILEDCDNDDDDCYDYLEAVQSKRRKGINSHYAQPLFGDEFKEDDLGRRIFTVKIFDLLGKELFQGSPNDIDYEYLQTNFGVLIYASFDKSGRLLESKKVISIK